MEAWELFMEKIDERVLGARILIPLAVAAMLAAGCSKQAEPTNGHEGHAHNHPASAVQPGKGAKCAHGAAKQVCFICDPALRDKGRLWCNEHARYEDRCWKCHPDAQDKQRLYCEEHGLYEDECFLCHPEVGGKKAEVSAPASGELQCREHGVPESQCGICRPETLGRLKPGEGMMVRLPSEQSGRMVGLQTAVVEPGTMAEAVECYAEISYNQNRLSQVASPVGGIIQEVAADLGAKVEEKQVVARIWSAAIAEAVAKAVLSHQTVEREQKLRAQRVTPEKDLQEAEAAHRAACQQLRLLGFTEEQVDVLGARPSEAVLMEVRSPFAGEVVERAAVQGSLVEAGKPLFTVVDRSVMWAMLSIPESALARVRVGQDVRLRVDALPDREFTGKLTWIGADVDERNRMARARAEIPNPDGALRSRMFARARVLTRQSDQALVVPAEAIQKVDRQNVVFVKNSGDLFVARVVRVGARLDGRCEVVEGLRAGEVVATRHGFTLKSHLLSSRMGAGCADD
jgi:cobalt-zinc-cadmium efflux system membrane fusion protein